MSSSWKRSVASGLETIWRGAARAAGAFGRFSPARWRSDGGRRVLVVAPHPDDEIACGGAILLHRRAGDQVHIVHVTDGRGSRALGLGPEEMARRRRLEAAAAARVLGIEGGASHWLGLREWEWENGTLVGALDELLRRIRPHIVYAPSRVDFHPEHIRVAQCLSQAIGGAGLDAPLVRVYQVQVPLTPLLVNLVAPIDAVADRLGGVVECYETQTGSIARCLRMKRYGAAFYPIGARLVEEFWQLEPRAYQAVQAAAALDHGFRGLRARPSSDPLSYLSGLPARRRLRRQAQSP
jgi:LmbE family N-acetylglucosaminyl deacetylase